MNHIDPTAEINTPSTIINSSVGRMGMVGMGARLCYSTMDNFSYIGENTKVFSSKIGKFCSIAWNVSVNPANHDYHRMTQHPILYATRYGMIESRDKVFYNQFKEVTIGNDVWIGCNSLIMGGGKDWRRCFNRSGDKNL